MAFGWLAEGVEFEFIWDSRGWVIFDYILVRVGVSWGPFVLIFFMIGAIIALNASENILFITQISIGYLVLHHYVLDNS